MAWVASRRLKCFSLGRAQLQKKKEGQKDEGNEDDGNPPQQHSREDGDGERSYGFETAPQNKWSKWVGKEKTRDLRSRIIIISSQLSEIRRQGLECNSDQSGLGLCSGCSFPISHTAWSGVHGPAGREETTWSVHKMDRY